MKIFQEREDFIFNTKVYQRIYTNNCDANKILEKATRKMKDYEYKFNFFKEDSEVSKINNNAGEKFVKVSQETFEIIKQAKYYSSITDGLFDITIAPLVKAWSINTENPNILSKEKVDDLISLVNYNDIILDEKNLSVMLKKENQKIDLGGIAKGYIADKIIDFYKDNNILYSLVNIGGNIKLSEKKDNEIWNIGIYEPQKHSDEILCSLLLKNTSVVTSGGYERVFKCNGEYYHHILNSKTGYPCKTDLKSITIISENSIQADAFSTSLFIMGKVKAAKFMKNNNISGVMITEDDEIIISNHMLNNFRLNKEYKVFSF